MNDEGDNRDHDRDSDSAAAITAHYRAVADESAPRHLDDAVLAAARKSAGSRNIFPGPTGWYRPAAIAATLLLGVLILLQLTDTGILQPEPPNSATGSPPEAPTDAFSAAAEAEAERIRSLSGARDTTRTAPAGDAAMVPPQRLPAVNFGSDDGCNEAQRSSAGRWWQCIEALQAEGRAGAAERELNALLHAYPQFALPENP